MTNEIRAALVPALENVLDVLGLKALFLDALFAGYSRDLDLGIFPTMAVAA